MKTYLKEWLTPGSGFQIVEDKRLKWIGKPDSVMTLKKSHSDHSSCPRIAPGVERPYPRARVDHPTLLFGLAPGGVCQASIITDEPVSSYLAFSTLPASDGGRYIFCGTFPRSLGAAVSGHPVLRSPDFPPLDKLEIVRSDRLIHFSLPAAEPDRCLDWPADRLVYWRHDIHN
jgi:hypothetical protein